jgi:DNA invertase Pin-like site-specific DNA recombinase
MLALPQRLAFLGRVSTVDQQDPTLSLPRQLRNAQAALPAQAEIVAYFYDVESGRKDPDQRGLGTAHQRFDIPIPRDGGLNDLLAEASRPNRRFDAVICESIERVARRSYYGTKIEHDLERAGVPLLAADEPLAVNGKRATQVITRRIKQGLAEWYVLEVLEKSRDGMCEHTRQGWNIGRPPYGYAAERVPHPVPARRAEGKTKTRLVLDPERAPVVAQIFTWRVADQLGYKAIAERLNRNLDRYPPPVPNDPARALGAWCDSTVTNILRNPKYTGYMVWNRVSENTTGRVNPPEAWVWSPEPTHPAILTRELFDQAGLVGARHAGSRDGDGPNLAHPHTKRTYLLRSMVFCAACGRRMRGHTIQQRRYTYYTCRLAEAPGPDAAARWPDHPPSVNVREDYLLDGILAFFAESVFHPQRRERLAQQLHTPDPHATQAARQQQASLQRAIDDLDARMRRLVRTLELDQALDDSDGRATFAHVRQRLGELQRQRDAKAGALAAADDQAQRPEVDAVELLDALPASAGELGGVPEPLLRQLFTAFQLEVRYDKHTNTATLQVTLHEDRLEDLRAVAEAVIDPQRPTLHGQAADAGPLFAQASPVAPQITVATPAATMASRSRPVVGSRAPRSTRSVSQSRWRAKVRMVTTGPSGASGGSTAWKRSPPGRRASTQGLASSTRRPSGAITRWTSVASASAEGSRTGRRCRRPSRSTQTSAGPLTSTSVTPGSASRGASGPRPVSSSTIARTVLAKLGSGTAIPSSRSAVATAARSPFGSAASGPVALRRRCTRATSSGAVLPAGPSARAGAAVALIAWPPWSLGRGAAGWPA